MNYLNVFVKKYDQILLGGIILLTAFGTIMLFSASAMRSLEITQNQTDTYYLQAHLKRLLVGILLMIVFMKLDYRKLKEWSVFIFGGAVFLLVLTLALDLIRHTPAPARWLMIGPLSIQTSDIARIALIIFLSAFIDNQRENIKDFNSGYLICLLAIGSIAVLIALQPNLSTTAMILIISFIMLFLGGAKLKHLLATAGAGIIFLSVVVMSWPYMRKRLITFLFPEDVSTAALHQINQSLISLANGGLFGMGLGNSYGKNLFLPTPHTDFIFAIVGEELGILGTMFVLILFLFIFHRGIQIAKESSDTFGILLALGISYSFILYAFINVAVVTNLVPTTGLAMPLVSYGGSGTVVHLATLGILLNISQSKRSVTGSDWKKRIYG